MKNNTSFIYYYTPNSDTLSVVLHGGSYDIDTPFMKRVFEVCREGGHSTIAFNFPYSQRGDEHSSGSELREELEALQNYLEYCDYKSYKKVRFVAKSLGAIVGSFYLNKLSSEEEVKFSIVVLGYVTGHVKLNQFKGPITIIQGEKDKFGGIEKVKEDLKNARSNKIKYFEVKGADHSFKNPNTGEYEFLDEVMGEL